LVQTPALRRDRLSLQSRSWWFREARVATAMPRAAQRFALMRTRAHSRGLPRQGSCQIVVRDERTPHRAIRGTGDVPKCAARGAPTVRTSPPIASAVASHVEVLAGVHRPRSRAAAQHVPVLTVEGGLDAFPRFDLAVSPFPRGKDLQDALLAVEAAVGRRVERAGRVRPLEVGAVAASLGQRVGQVLDVLVALCPVRWGGDVELLLVDARGAAGQGQHQADGPVINRMVTPSRTQRGAMRRRPDRAAVAQPVRYSSMRSAAVGRSS
jgi:hypothetical protein